MALTELLASGMDAAGYPAADSLTTKVVFSNDDWLNRLDPAPSAAWISQGKVALLPLHAGSADRGLPIKLAFIPSNSAATFTVTIWMYVHELGNWSKLATNGTVVSSGGSVISYIDNPGDDPIYFQVSAISAGTLSIYYDGSNARVIS